MIFIRCVAVSACFSTNFSGDGTGESSRASNAKKRPFSSENHFSSAKTVRTLSWM